MAQLQTHRAHCGDCSGLMAMRVDPRGWYFVCCECGVETTPRPTIVEADKDVLWVPLTHPHGRGSVERP